MEELLANQPMEYEEVVLKRSKSNRRLGLTLCYGGTDDSETDIFVSEVRSRLTASTSRVFCLWKHYGYRRGWVAALNRAEQALILSRALWS